MARTSLAPPVIIHVSPDASGSAVMTLPRDARAIRIVGPDVSVLELEASPDLRSLDLRECGLGAQLRLNLRCVAPLERLELPETRGSRLVLSLAQHRELDGRADSAMTAGDSKRAADFVPVQIFGRILSFNLAWSSVTSRGERRLRGLEWRMRRDRHLDGLCIGPFDAPPPTHIDGWVVTESELVDSAFGVPPSHLWLVDGAAPRGLSLDGSLDSLELLDFETPWLRFERCTRARVRPAGRLGRVIGDADRLLLRESGQLDALTLEGAVGHADLLDVHCETLRLIGCSKLHLEACSGITRIETLSDGETLDLVTRGVSPEVEGQYRQRVQRPTPREIDEQFDRGGRMGRNAMLAWAAQVKAPSDIETALRVLCAAVDSQRIIALDAWRARSRMHDRVVPFSLRGEWCWPFPEDQALRGFEVDVFLWLRLLAESPREARKASQSLVVSGAPETLASLLFVAARDDVEPAESDALLELARSATDGGTELAQLLREHTGYTNAIWLHWRRPKRRKKAGGVVLPRAKPVARFLPSTTDLGWVDIAMHALIRLASKPLGARAAASVAAWLAMCLPWEPGIRALGRLRAHGCRSALGALERVRATLAEDELLDSLERTRSLALVAEQLLMPDASPRFVEYRVRGGRVRRHPSERVRAE